MSQRFWRFAVLPVSVKGVFLFARIVIAGVAGAQAAGTNLVANGGFESLDARGRPVGWATDARHWRVARGAGTAGSNALVWENDDPNYGVTVMQVLNLQEAHMYCLEADVKVVGRIKASGKGGASVYVECFGDRMKWLGGTYGDTLRDTGGEWRHIRSVSNPIRDIAQHFRLGVTVGRGATGKVLFDNIAVTEFALSPPPDPKTVRYRYRNGAGRGRVCIGADRICYVNGKPFFPFGFYGGNKDMMRIGKSPFNTLMLYGAPGRERLDEARRNGLMIIAGVNHFPLDAGGDAALAAYMASVRDHPALLAWYVFDEAGVLDIKKWNRRKELVERLDADHPTWGVLNRPDLSGHYLNAFDVAGADPYPVPRDPLAFVAKAAKQVMDGTGRERAVWMVPQAFSWRSYGRPDGRVPTRAELLEMSHMCMREGATGIIYFKYADICVNHDETTTAESRWNDLVFVANEVLARYGGAYGMK